MGGEGLVGRHGPGQWAAAPGKQVPPVRRAGERGGPGWQIALLPTPSDALLALCFCSHSPRSTGGPRPDVCRRETPRTPSGHLGGNRTAMQLNCGTGRPSAICTGTKALRLPVSPGVKEASLKQTCVHSVSLAQRAPSSRSVSRFSVCIQCSVHGISMTRGSRSETHAPEQQLRSS